MSGPFKPKNLCIHNNDPDTCPEKGDKPRCVVERRTGGHIGAHPTMIQTARSKGGQAVSNE